MNRKRQPGLGLIEQSQDPDDFRKNIYRVTPKGEALIAAVTQALGG